LPPQRHRSAALDEQFGFELKLRFNQKNAEFTESRGHFLFAGPGSLLAGCLPGSSLQMIGGKDAFCGEAGRLDVLQTLEAALGVLAVQDMVDSVARSCQATV